MTDTRADTPSVVERTRPVAAGAPVVAAHFLGNTAVFVLGEEALLLVGKDGSGAARAGPWRRDPGGGVGRRSHRHRRRRRQGGGDRCRGRERGPRHRPEAPLDRSRRCRAERRRGLVGGQAGVRAHRQGRRARARGALDRRRIGVRAEGLSARHRPLQWRHALVSERAEAAPEKLEWKGSHLGARYQPRRQVRGDDHAGADAARLAPRRPQGHADVGLRRARALARLDRRRQVARDLGLDPADPVAVPGQGRPHGQDAAHCWRRPRRRSRSSPATRSRRWWRSAMPTGWC